MSVPDETPAPAKPGSSRSHHLPYGRARAGGGAAMGHGMNALVAVGSKDRLKLRQRSNYLLTVVVGVQCGAGSQASRLRVASASGLLLQRENHNVTMLACASISLAFPKFLLLLLAAALPSLTLPYLTDLPLLTFPY
ncbi:uncharacterized protein LY89DRAFT_212807 [Mollisia scopiformis]|uniref:Uncharacterized protein n=1 Tax=Mollisia scopiformis TaxID=149040 RepID=A0A194WV09_MOLSC|nr:uncharacterized protein LY89DRAFT_212807 [Mollisia scopiformis]KUJ11800.1 hypothetical protein LY89DRAFT_212807 [Mollisia scopiformis]